VLNYGQAKLGSIEAGKLADFIVISKKGPDTFKSIVSGLFFESGIPTLYGVSNRKKLNWLANHSLKSQ
jgi:hypothetical protein